MRVLLDECLPRRVGRSLIGHAVVTVPQAGWAGKKNGELLAVAAGEFDVLVTVDRNLRHQQRLADVAIAVIVLVAADNSYPTLAPLMSKVAAALTFVRPGQVVHIK